MPAKKLPPGERPLKTLERVVSKSGLGSRREARSWIAAGRAAVNGTTVVDPDRWVDLERDQVTFDGEPLAPRRLVYLLLNKPAGILTTYRDPQKRPTVYELLPPGLGFLIPVGRLDLDTSGLLLMTSDTTFAETVTNPRYGVPKTYRVEASRHLDESELARLREGVELSDGPTRPAAVERVGEREGRTTFEMTITEGRNRQVRRMVEAIGGRVERLERIAIGPLTAEGLEPGGVRELTQAEMESLVRSSRGDAGPKG
ncbi:MAG TPA: pseudouridine synthase [Thermoanaerobaculia bacterium]|nr:pseudouridine synthase [Thermoanaerobaculia bacterium]